MQSSQVLWTFCAAAALAAGLGATGGAAEPAPAAAKPADKAVADLSAGIPAGGSSAADERIRKALAEPTDLEFVETPLSDVIDSLQKKHGINIQLDVKALDDSGTGTDTPVTRHIKCISLGAGLRLLLRSMDLNYCIRDEVLLITTKEGGEAELRLRLYPVHDLLDPSRQHNLLLNPAADLIATITNSVASTTWDEVGGPGSIVYLPAAQSLVISQTAEVHEQIRDLLIAARQALAAAPSQDQRASADPNAMFVAVYWLDASNEFFQIASEPLAAGDKDAKPAERGRSAGAPRALLVSSRALADDVARVVPKMVAPESWQGGGGQGSIESIGPGVVVRQTRPVHQQVAGFIQSIAQARKSAKPTPAAAAAGGFF